MRFPTEAEAFKAGQEDGELAREICNALLDVSLISPHYFLAAQLAIINELRTRRERLDESQQWIDVSKGLPEKSLDVFVVARFTECFLATPGMYSRCPAEVVSGNYVHMNAKIYTHWMALPPLQGREPKPPTGICRFCGCTETRACDGGCHWVDAEKTVCSARACVAAFSIEKAQ